MPDYRTQAGYRVIVDGGLFKSYVSCYGCNRGWKVSERDAHRNANQHAGSCHAVPGRQSRGGGGVLSR